MRASLALIGALIAAAAGTSSAARGTSNVHDLLRATGAFTQADLAALDRGEPLARVLRTERREIAVLGAIRIRGARERLLARYRDFSNLKKSDLVLQVGTFSATPSAADLAALALEPYDLDAPKACVPGECAVRLSTEAMRRMRGAVNWTAPDARHQSAAAWRDMLASVARAYVSGGDTALPEYVNKKDPLKVPDEMRAVYEGFSAFASAAPEFFAYLREYPRARLAGTENLLYWSVNDLGIRPVVGITHQAIYAPRTGPALVALKRVYAAHYVDAGLGVTLAADDGAGGFYMVTLERIRTRSLVSLTRALVRSIVQDKSRSGVEKLLRSSKQSIESTSSPSRQPAAR